MSMKLNRVALALVVASTVALGVARTADAAPVKPRAIVTTDIETDDYDSMIRYLLFASDYDTVGIVYGSSQYHWAGDGKGTLFFNPGREYTTPQTSWRWTGTQLIQELIESYRTAYPNLRTHDAGYPTPDSLLSVVKIGNIDFEGDVSHETEGSNWIKDKLLDDVPGPLFLQAWGGSNTIARALMSIEAQYKDTPQWEAIQRKVSDKAVIYMWGKQDNAYDTYIGPKWPGIQTNNISANAWGYWTRATATNVLPEDRPYFQPEWTRANVLNVGPLGAKYRVWGDDRFFPGDQLDVFGINPYPGGWIPAALPKDHFISEGDTPAFLNLIDTGLRSNESPSYGGWGNRLAKASATTNYWNTVATETNDAGTAIARYTSQRWVGAAQRDFAARLKWTVTPAFAGANHEPVVSVASGLNPIAAPGEQVRLDGAASDPDGNGLTYKWWQYKDADTYPGSIALSSTNTAASGFTVPADAQPGQTIHAILEVTDDGTPALTRWQRVIVTVVSKTDVPGGVGGTVPATLSLTLGTPGTFGAFTPGLTKDYTASTTAKVISSAGDAALSVSDPGHLTNGAFSLPSPLVVEFSKSAWTAPVSNDSVAITFKQHIDASDALRTGTYSKTLTFTLSTTTP
jgi:hypothetical protein